MVSQKGNASCAFYYDIMTTTETTICTQDIMTHIRRPNDAIRMVLLDTNGITKKNKAPIDISVEKQLLSLQLSLSSTCLAVDSADVFMATADVLSEFCISNS